MYFDVIASQLLLLFLTTLAFPTTLVVVVPVVMAMHKLVTFAGTVKVFVDPATE
jgi:hypothetical protein